MNEKEYEENVDTFQRYTQILNKELESEKLRRMELQNNQVKQSGFGGNIDGNIIEFQIKPEKELDKIYHYLMGHELVEERWQEPEDDRLRILSDHGAKRIMNLLALYVNKIHLLSVYEDFNVIYSRLNTIANTLNDLIYMSYEDLFFYPKPEELYEQFMPLIEKHNLNITEQELYEKCMIWSEEELRNKTKHYRWIVNSILDVIESVYRRAYRGEERARIGRFTHVTQNAPVSELMPMNQTKFSLVKPSTWK